MNRLCINWNINEMIDINNDKCVCDHGSFQVIFDSEREARQKLKLIKKILNDK